MLKTRKIRIVAAVLGAFTLFALLWVAATVARLKLPVPTGQYAVGRTRVDWVDESRRERLQPEGHREVIAEVWYPAKPGTGTPSPYIPELGAVSTEMVRSGQLSQLEAGGLAWIDSNAKRDAEFAEIGHPCPVIVLSPGNATNVEFYSAYGEELASRGFIVLGVNHPYDVGGVRLDDGSVATYRERPFDDREALRVRMDERVADVRFLVDCLAALNEGDGPLARHLDLSKIGIMGHSLGGMTAAEACTADARFAACINIDGLHAGNPYAARPDGAAPPQPYLYIGKERSIGPRTAELLAQNPRGTVVKVADAEHSDFADGNLFKPALNPLERNAYRVLTLAKQEVASFFEKWLR